MAHFVCMSGAEGAAKFFGFFLRTSGLPVYDGLGGLFPSFSKCTSFQIIHPPYTILVIVPPNVHLIFDSGNLSGDNSNLQVKVSADPVARQSSMGAPFWAG